MKCRAPARACSPEGVAVAPRAEAAGVHVHLALAGVLLHDDAGRALLDVHALVAVGGDDVPADEDVAAAIRSVIPLLLWWGGWLTRREERQHTCKEPVKRGGCCRGKAEIKST